MGPKAILMFPPMFPPSVAQSLASCGFPAKCWEVPITTDPEAPCSVPPAAQYRICAGETLPFSGPQHCPTLFLGGAHNRWQRGCFFPTLLETLSLTACSVSFYPLSSQCLRRVKTLVHSHAPSHYDTPCPSDGVAVVWSEQSCDYAPPMSASTWTRLPSLACSPRRAQSQGRSSAP